MSIIEFEPEKLMNEVKKKTKNSSKYLFYCIWTPNVEIILWPIIRIWRIKKKSVIFFVVGVFEIHSWLQTTSVGELGPMWKLQNKARDSFLGRIICHGRRSTRAPRSTRIRSEDQFWRWISHDGGRASSVLTCLSVKFPINLTCTRS